MKKVISISLVCISILSAQTEIIFSKTFEKKVKPDTLTTNIIFNTQKTTQEIATNRLTKISEYVDAQNSVKAKGGDYNVYPHIVYNNGMSHQDGYDGSISYRLSSTKAEVLNKFTRELQRYGEKNSMSVSVSSASWGMSDNQESSDGGVEDLRLEAIIWSDKYAKSLSNKIGKNCSVNKINFSGGEYYATPMMMKTSSAMSDSTPTPTNDEQKINLNANIELVCK